MSDIKDKLGMKSKQLGGIAAIGSIKSLTLIIFLVLFLILGKIFVEGIEVINWDFLIDSPRNNMTEGGIGPAIFGTIAVSILMLLFAVPIGVFSAIYLNEYATDNLLTRLIRASVNNLAGTPSIVIGLFGFGFFILVVGKSIDHILQTGLLFGQPAMLWASATLAVLILPTIIVTTLEALNSIPYSQRAAAYGLGATKWQTIKYVVIPQAKPGILTGVILSLSRGTGEIAPILFLGCAFFLPELPIAQINMGLFSIPMINPTDQFMHLAYHIFILATQSTNPALTMPIQYGTTLILIMITLLLNLAAIIYRYKFRKTLEITGKG